MDVFEMRIVVALAYEGNMTRAANTIHISQPTLSYHVDRIEAELGFPLFDRSRKGTVLTPAGEIFVEGIQHIVTDFDLVVERSRRKHASSLTPTIILASTADSHSAMTRIFEYLQTALPDYSFQQLYCSSFEVLEDLQAGKADIAYRTKPEAANSKGMEFIPLDTVEESWLLSERHPLATRDIIAMEDLDGCKLYLVPEGTLSPASDRLRAAITDRRINVRISDYTDESAMLLSLMRGDAVALTRSGAENLLPQGIKRVPIACREFANTEGLVYRSADREHLKPIIEAACSLFGARTEAS